MQYSEIKVRPSLSGKSDNVLSFTATTVTTGGKKIKARVFIHADNLHYQMTKASRNRSHQSVAGALTVKIESITEVG